MKTLLILLSLLPLCIEQSKAQVSSACFLNFHYDNSGNRVKRDSFCPTVNPEEYKEWDITVSPNPTSGPVSVSFTPMATRAHINVINAGNSMLVDEFICTDCTVLNFNMSSYTNGTYILDIFVSDAYTGSFPYNESVIVVKGD